MTQKPMTPSQFVKSNDTAILEQKLREAPEGSVVTYDDLSRAIGRNVRKFAIGCLYSARRILEQEGIHTGCIAKEGITRLTPSESVCKARSHVNASRRVARRGRSTVEKTDLSRLTVEERQSALAIAAQSSAIELFGSKKAERKLTEAATNKSGHLPLGDTLALFNE
jgi:hypothetical protein